MAGFGFFRNNTQSNAPRTAEQTTLARPYRLGMGERAFINTKTLMLYRRLLSRCYHKTTGWNDETVDSIAMSVFMSIENSATKNGTIPLVADAMTNRAKIYLVYSEQAGLVRQANMDERTALDEAYSSNNNALGKLPNGLRGMVLDFTNYELTLLIKCYMAMIYAVMDAANTQVNMSRSIQIKINKLRDNISVLTSDDATKQANNINSALKSGDSVLVDKLDEIIQTAINADSTEKALNIFYSGLAADLGLSVSFVSGVLTSGMSATGDADINYEEEGIKDYWSTIWKPICIRLYGESKVKFLSDRWRNMSAKLQNLVYIENSTLFTEEQKQEYAQSIINDVV